MKKTFSLICLCCVAALALVGCDSADEYDALNQLISAERSHISLTVSTTLNDLTLTGSYLATTTEEGVRIDYAYETFRLIEETEGGYVVPNEVKASHQGSMLIADGQVVSAEGEAPDLSVEQITSPGVHFDGSYFAEPELTAGKFAADVIEPAKFLQQQLTATDMRVEVAYTGTAIRYMNISYTAGSGAKVRLAYQFSE